MRAKTCPVETRECKNHGLTEFLKDGSGTWRCRICRNNRVKNRRRELKRLLVEYKGGCCETCGYDKFVEVLEFHHRDPDGKDFKVSQGSWSLERMKAEADKCALLCANCHREEHIRLGF